MQKHRAVTSLAAIAFAGSLLAAGSAASAQQETFSTQETRYTLIPYTIYNFPADIGDDGEMSVWRGGLGFDVATPINDRIGFRFSVLGEYSDYDFDDVGDVIGGGSDFDAETYILRVAPAFMYRHDERWMFFAGPIVEFGFEGGADLGDAVTYGGFGSVRYRVNDKFAFSLGATAKTTIEDDVTVFPIGGIEYKFADDLVVGTSGAQLGFNVRVGKRISERLAVSVFAGYQSRDYRLDDDSLIPEGVLRDTRVPVGLELSYRPNDNVVLRLGGGVVAWQETEFDDKDGHKIGRDRSDPTGFFAFSASITF